MLPLLLKACPSFTEKWEEHKREWKEEEVGYLPYLALDELAQHLIRLYERNDMAEFSDIFEIVERLHTEGEHYVREAATIGLLEGIQNHLANSGKDTEVFRGYLLPVSAKWWDQLNLFFNNKIKYVGETIDK